MIVRILGVDSAQLVTEKLIDAASRVLGTQPAFWGRYFTSPSTTGSVEYRHRLEDANLVAHSIRVLPIARQTNRVGGSQDEGLHDGLANGLDLLQTFGEDYLAQQGGKFFIFLDVEGGGISHLSTKYYAGWIEGLAQSSARVQFLPCIYGIPSDTITWTALRCALENGSACHGLWLSHPLQHAQEPVPWDNTKVVPNPDPGVPVLLWQYMFARDGVDIDRNQVNPMLGPMLDFLQFLVLPAAH